jgi:hypothetical protein
MTYQEIVARLLAVDITPQVFAACFDYELLRLPQEHITMPWLGIVRLVEDKRNADADIQLTYHLEKHDVYLQLAGAQLHEPREEDYGYDKDEYFAAMDAWVEKSANVSFVWEFYDHYSPVKPVTKTIVVYEYAPELANADAQV